MMGLNSILLAGFGGQGVLFAGKILAHSGMLCDKQVSWLPSYGPEMRGGTANVGVIISDDEIGSPFVSDPENLIVMNQPSFEKFEPTVVSGGTIVSDNSMIFIETKRKDVTAYYIPATKLANENNLKGLANIIMLGKFLKVSGIFDYKILEEAIKKNVPKKREHLLEPNLKALKIGYEYN